MNAISDNCVSDLVIDVKTGDTIALNGGVVSYDMLKARWVIIRVCKGKKRVPKNYSINWGM